MKSTVFPPGWPVPIRPSLERPRKPIIEADDFPGSLAAVISSLQKSPIVTALQPGRRRTIELDNSPGSFVNVISAVPSPLLATEDTMEVDLPDLDPQDPDTAPPSTSIIVSKTSKAPHPRQHISGITSESDLTSLSSPESESEEESPPKSKKLMKHPQRPKNPRPTERKKCRPTISSSDSEAAPVSFHLPGQGLYNMSGRPVLINYIDVDKFEVCFFHVFFITGLTVFCSPMCLQAPLTLVGQ